MNCLYCQVSTWFLALWTFQLKCFVYIDFLRTLFLLCSESVNSLSFRSFGSWSSSVYACYYCVGVLFCFCCCCSLCSLCTDFIYVYAWIHHLAWFRCQFWYACFCHLVSYDLLSFLLYFRLLLVCITVLWFVMKLKIGQKCIAFTHFLSLFSALYSCSAGKLKPRELKLCLLLVALIFI